LNKKLSQCLLSISLLLFTVIGWCDSTKTPQKIQRIDQKIHSVSGDLKNFHSRRKKQQQRLAKTELQLSSLTEQLHETERALKKNEQTRQQLAAQQQLQTDQLKQAQNLLNKQLEQLYRLGKQPLLKLLLNNESPEKTGRLYTYYQYIDANTKKQTQQIRAHLQHLEKTLQITRQETKRWHTLKAKLTEERQQFQSSQKQRAAILKKLDRDIKKSRHQLAALESDKKALKQAIAAIQKKRRTAKPYTSLQKLKGQLPWPTPGKVENRFHSTIADTAMRRDGVVIAAPGGQSVRAIAKGQIVFAKWLSGYGQLIIIDHGKGYMSLYGRNQKLFKKRGERVHAGEIIASVGRSGGQQKTGLYFAIRHNAKPLNPSQWCTRRA
jgi:septal ring factor EnvC (AmiA/AmiB activator)